MLTLTMSHNSLTRSTSPSPYPSPTYSSDLVGAFICKAQNYCRKCYIYTVGYLSNWYYFLLPYYNSILLFNIFISYIIKVQHFLHTTIHTIQRKRKGL